MSDKIMNQYVEAGCPDGELDQGRAIHWAGNEIDRLRAELAAARENLWATQKLLKASNDIGERDRAELAEAREEIKALQKRVRGFAESAAKLRALCATIEQKLKHGDFVQSQTANCGCDLCQALRLAIVGRGEGCNCDMRTKLVGDGCAVCNPALAEEMRKEEPK